MTSRRSSRVTVPVAVPEYPGTTTSSSSLTRQRPEAPGPAGPAYAFPVCADPSWHTSCALCWACGHY
eukprot:1513689-Rhodomonas_salina.2